VYVSLHAWQEFCSNFIVWSTLQVPPFSETACLIEHGDHFTITLREVYKLRSHLSYAYHKTQDHSECTQSTGAINSFPNSCKCKQVLDMIVTDRWEDRCRGMTYGFWRTQNHFNQRQDPDILSLSAIFRHQISWNESSRRLCNVTLYFSQKSKEVRVTRYATGTKHYQVMDVT
jgi:hypothetical protein